MPRLQNKIILITGGARGQGAAEARLFAREGAKVVITDILDNEGKTLAAELGDKATYLHHDVTNENEWHAAIAAAEKMGGLHGLINNAGIYQPKGLLETDTELFNRHTAINQLGPFLGMKLSVPLMEKSGGGSIVNISSTAGLKASPRAFAYSATKWALRGMTKTAALDLADSKIRVNSIHPGPIDTPMLHVRTPEQNAARVAQVPMKRMGTAEEIADLVLFLVSDESRYITGAEISIDGGATL
jgi:3alpha(or 20beta)-hydroxysteroid dehydrogenase